MAASVLTSLTLGWQNSFVNAGGVGPAKFNIRTEPFSKYGHIYGTMDFILVLLRGTVLKFGFRG